VLVAVVDEVVAPPEPPSPAVPPVPPEPAVPPEPPSPAVPPWPPFEVPDEVPLSPHEAARAAEVRRRSDAVKEEEEALIGRGYHARHRPRGVTAA
jgi:hypothetical protein